MHRVDIKELLDAGVHFGHRTQRWNPKMKPFIFEARNGIYVIDLEHTVKQLEAAQDFLRETAASGKKVLFVGCKKQAQETIKLLAQKSNSYYVTERWLGGTMTNLTTIRKSVARMKQIDTLEANGTTAKMPKQEVSVMRRENAKLHRNLDGIKDMEKYPAAIVIVDVPRESIAVAEARRLNIPVVSKSREEAAEHFGWFATFAGMDAPSSSERTRSLLGWKPDQPGLIADLDHPAYFGG